MDPDDTLAGLRAAAQDQIADNALALDQAPEADTSPVAVDPNDTFGGLQDQVQGQIVSNAQALDQAPATGDETPGPKDAAAAAVDSMGAVLDSVKKGLPPAKTTADRVARTVGGVAAEAPGRVLSAVDVLTSDNKPRALAGLVGGEIGGAIGGLVPGLEPVTVPAGAFLGNQAGKFVYDHAGPVAARIQQGIQKAAGRLEHEWDGGLSPYVAPIF